MSKRTLEDSEEKGSKNSGVRVILGTMTFGPAVGNAHIAANSPLKMWCQTPPDVARAQLNALANTPHAIVQSGPEQGKVLLDTAIVYQDQHTEKVLGQIFKADPELRAKFSIHTKANKFMAPHRSLSKESILHQASLSLSSLQIDRIDIYYLHGPDINTDIESTLDGIHTLHQEGKIGEFGLSNYPAWKVADIWHRCRARKMVLPTVYQGAYNAITRSVEFEGTPCFRELGIRSYHYNPLAGGLLTGKYEGIESSLKDSGRFGKESPIGGDLYSARYWKKQIFDALEIIRAACEKEGVSMAAAALRWLLHHSVLSGHHGDGLIFGASSLENCLNNLEALRQGPLSPALVDAYDQAWKTCSPVSASYFRDYGTAPGICDTFLLKFQDFVPKSN